MAIQYSGNAQTSTFTPSNKQDIINAVGAALLAAGWTTVSGGSGTTAWKLQSATTPQGFAIRVLMQDNGGTCITFSLESSDGVLVGGNSTTVGGAFLNPTAGGPFQIVCNKYQAFMYAVPYAAVGGTFAAFGVPFVPSWVASVTSRVGWMMGNAFRDTDTSERYSFRKSLATGETGDYQDGAKQALFDGALWSYNAEQSNSYGINLASYTANGVWTGGSGVWGYRWENNAALLIDAILSWGGSAINAEPKFKGQIWDGVVSTDNYAGDSTASFDGHNWTVVTNNNTLASALGTLLLATS